MSSVFVPSVHVPSAHVLNSHVQSVHEPSAHMGNFSVTDVIFSVTYSQTLSSTALVRDIGKKNVWVIE